MWADAHADRQEDSMGGIRFKSAVKAAFVAAAMLAAPAAAAFVSAPSADAATGTSVLMPGQHLYHGQFLVNGNFTLAMRPPLVISAAPLRHP
jgi:hypothetical protein